MGLSENIVPVLPAEFWTDSKRKGRQSSANYFSQFLIERELMTGSLVYVGVMRAAESFLNALPTLYKSFVNPKN